MDPEEQDAPEVLETSEPVSTPAEETIETLREKNAKLYTRAKQAEGFELIDGAWVKKPKAAPEVQPQAKKEDDLSPRDTIAIMQAQVPVEDVDDVMKAAKVLGVSVIEALKDPVTKAILERKAALRKTAEATNTSTARPAAKKVTDDEILQKASEGNIPDKGSTEAEQLFWARHGGKR